MKRYWIFLLSLLLVVSLAACGSKTEPQTPAAPPIEAVQPAEKAEAPAPEVPEDTAPIAVEMEINGERQPTEVPEETPAAVPEEAPQETSSAADEPAPQPEPAQPHPLEALLPADWAGRYVLEDAGNEVRLYCKRGYGKGESMNCWLFSVTTLNDAVTLPEYTELGMYNGAVVVATLPPDYLSLSNFDLQEEYRDLCADLAGIFDTIRNRLEPVQHPVDYSQYTYDLTNRGYGVYCLNWNSWTAESQSAHVYNAYGYPLDIMVVTADGRVFFHVGGQDIWGTARAYAGPGDPPEGWPFWLIELGGTVYEADMLQLVLSVRGMPAVTLTSGQTIDFWEFNWIGTDCEIYLPPDVSQEQVID